MISVDRNSEIEKNCPKNSDCNNKFSVHNETLTIHEADNTSNTNKALIFQRLDKRKEALDQQRSSQLSESFKNIAEHQHVRNKLNEWSKIILNKIEVSSTPAASKNSDVKKESSSTEEYSKLLGSLSEEIQKFDNFFNENSLHLPRYDVRHTQAATVEIKEKFVALQELLNPKKKFGFKSKYKKNTLNKPDDANKAKILDLTEETLNAEQNFAVDKGSYVVTNPDENGNIQVPRDQIDRKDVVIHGLGDETLCNKIIVKILGNPGTIHATNLINVIILCGPVSTSVFVENCVNCDFVVACQQLRIHASQQSNFYLHVTAKGIMEDCHSIGFAPYNLLYPAIEEDFSNSGLNKKTNTWNKIEDFNWLSKEMPSPNWHLLPESQMKNQWQL